LNLPECGRYFRPLTNTHFDFTDHENRRDITDRV